LKIVDKQYKEKENVWNYPKRRIERRKNKGQEMAILR